MLIVIAFIMYNQILYCQNDNDNETLMKNSQSIYKCWRQSSSEFWWISRSDWRNALQRRRKNGWDEKITDEKITGRETPILRHSSIFREIEIETTLMLFHFHQKRTYFITLILISRSEVECFQHSKSMCVWRWKSFLCWHREWVTIDEKEFKALTKRKRQEKREQNLIEKEEVVENFQLIGRDVYIVVCSGNRMQKLKIKNIIHLCDFPSLFLSFTWISYICWRTVTLVLLIRLTLQLFTRSRYLILLYVLLLLLLLLCALCMYEINSR